jgi:hypothetical protein
MMEYWSAGKMGLKEEKQFINDLLRFYYPTFHYPTLPMPWQALMEIKILAFSPTCRNSETYN